MDDGWKDGQKDKGRKIEIYIYLESYLRFILKVFTHTHTSYHIGCPPLYSYVSISKRCYHQKNIDLQSKINLMKVSVLCL